MFFVCVVFFPCFSIASPWNWVFGVESLLELNSPVDLFFWLFIDLRKTDPISLMNCMCLHLIWLQVTHICHLGGPSFECPVYLLSFKGFLYLKPIHPGPELSRLSAVVFNHLTSPEGICVCLKTRLSNCFENSIVNVSLGLCPGYFPPHLCVFPYFTPTAPPFPALLVLLEKDDTIHWVRGTNVSVVSDCDDLNHRLTML